MHLFSGTTSDTKPRRSGNRKSRKPRLTWTRIGQTLCAPYRMATVERGDTEAMLAVRSVSTA